MIPPPRLRIYLVDSGVELCKVWRQHLKSFDMNYQTQGIGSVSISSSPSTPITTLSPLPNQHGHVTAVVSPGNSLGLMNGGLDRVLKEAFTPQVEAAVQQLIHSGYSAPGSATVVHVPGDHAAKQMWDAEYLVHLPTMRVPRGVHVDDLESLRMVYDWTWNILSSVEKQNAQLDNPNIGTLIMSGLATGYGRIPSDIAGLAMIAAITIFYREEFTPIEKSLYTLKFLQEDLSWLPRTTIPDELWNLQYNPLTDGLPKLFMFTESSKKGYASLSFHA